MEPGRVADRYRLERELGRGAMGAVWLAYDETLHREVALKRVAGRLVGFGPDVVLARERFLREARLAARLNHPNAVAVHDVLVEDDQPWLVMEYVPARTLADVVESSGPLDPRRMARIGAALASALAAAHSVGITHRDVKPANVLLRDDDQPKLTDFGIARAAGDPTLTTDGALAGTPAYLAPEIARGEAPTPACDVWSLGATVYYAVEGHPPYGAAAPEAHPLALLGRIALEPVPPPRRAGALTPALGRMLAKDPRERVSAAEAVELLGAAGAGGGAENGAAADDVPAATVPIGRRRARWITAATAAVVLIGGVVTWLVLRSPDPAADPGGVGTALEQATSADAATTLTPTAGQTGGGASAGPETSGPPPTSLGPAPPITSAAPTAGFPPNAAQMEQFVAQHYAFLPHDPASAWAELTPSMQSTVGYDAYTAFWATVEALGVSGIVADPATSTATLTLTFTIGGAQTTEQHQLLLAVDPARPGYLAVAQDTRLG